MNPQNQIHKNDCMRAGVASLLGLPVKSLPDFMAGDEKDFLEEIEIEGLKAPRWWASLQQYLRDRNLAMFEIGLPKELSISPLPYPIYCLFTGRKKGGRKHVVVGELGKDLIGIHDPADQGGIDKIEGMIVLVPLDVHRFTVMGQTLERIEEICSAPISGQSTRQEIARWCKQALGKPLIETQSIIAP